ncbi:MAG: diguanylate cyclase [Nitrospinae bacterium]|nr:diguanylate cyclase [Nitrospinota bacterium]
MIDSENEQFVGMEVLIVDDTPANIDILARFLKQHGLNISIAPNGEIALKIIEKNKPDLILLDVMMPGIDGYQLCEKLKSNDQTKTIPIIFITAKSEVEDLVKGFDVGGVDYIVKPFQKKEVVARVKNQLTTVKLIHEKNKLIEELDSISRIDPLTGISNRRDMMEILENEQFRYERYGKVFCLLMFDIDFFKKVNDQYGHDMGDFVLKKVAQVLKGKCRKVDFLARWGGEEFLIVLPETNLLGGEKAAESMRKAIESEKFNFNDHEISVTMSIGVACQSEKEMNLEELLKVADERLYTAKERGRNQVVSF